MGAGAHPKSKSKSKKKHSNDVLDIEEADGNTNGTRPVQSQKQIVVTAHDGTVVSPAQSEAQGGGSKHNMVGTDSDDDELSLHYDGMNTPSKPQKVNTPDIDLDDDGSE